MTADDNERRQVSRSLGGLSAAANMTPDARRERASKAGTASAAKRKAEREAAGLPPARPRSGSKLMPERPELDAQRETIRIERDAAGLEPLSYDAEIREAIIRVRRDVAEATLAALKARGSQ